MTTPYVGEIRMFAGNYAPAGWAFCDGSFLSTSEYEALFTLIGTTYGGDGQSTFALPDLRGRLPVHAATGYTLGQMGGVEQVILTTAQMATHTHTAGARNETGNQPSPTNALWANSTLTQFANVEPDGSMSPSAIRPFGGGQPHDNMMPYLCVSFIIALSGIYPSQN
ncbi:MAG: phage tail protein [Bacillota bacterium]